MKISSLAAIALLLTGPIAIADEIEFPTYTSWAKHPVGTTIKLKSSTVGPTSSIITTITTKLVEVQAKKLILEVQRTSDATGRVAEGLPDRREVRRVFPLLPGVAKEDVLGTPKEAIAKGEETLKLAGREIKTFWYDTKGQGDAGPTETRTWLSNDVPDRLVRSVTKIPRASTVVTVELIEIGEPKK